MKARHRVPLVGSRLRRYEDPTRSRDPRVLAVVAQLQTIELPVPSPTFRSELRAQLVAVAPRLIEDGVAEQRQAARDSKSRAAKESEPGRRKIRLGRPLAVATTLVAICALVLGGAVWLSQKSLPGDTLYGLKRASESWQLRLDTNDTDKATDYLHFSQIRVQEAQDLLKRSTASGAGIQADGISAGTASELKSTLKTADSQLFAGWKLLADTATHSDSSAPLATMKNWAPGQIHRLNVLTARMPTKDLKLQAEKSTANAKFALDSAHKLTATLDKPTSAPAAPTTKPGTGGSAKPGTPATKSHNSSATRTASTGRPAGKPAATHAARRSTSAKPTTPASKTPKALLPSLIRPLLPSHKPLVSSCGISLPIGVHIGHCKTHS